MEKPYVRKHRARFLTIEEFQAVEAKVPDSLRPALRIALATGMRLKEVVGLRWEDVDRNADVLHILRNTKTGRRGIPIFATVQAFFSNRVRHLLSPMVFVDAEGRDYTSATQRDRFSCTAR